MPNISVARRYAKALLEIASESNSLDAVSQQLETFASALCNNAELADLATNPAYSRAQRQAVLEGILKLVPDTSTAVGNVLRLLVDRNRLASLPDIQRLFRDMADVRSGRVRGRITTAVPMQIDALERMRNMLERMTQRKVILDTHVDPKILGGASAQVGSVVYDGSVRSQLEDLRRTLKQ
ncbi:MAG: ATP synthase F1 subunit delta [Myxococcaceae bacterium]